MRRRLILMRHAKSSWSSEAADDHDRPLNKRGRRDARRVACALEERGWWPELVVSSTAKRTRQTWKRMRKALGHPGGVTPLLLDEGLYHGGLDDLWESSRGWPAEVEVVLALGHNPGWEMALDEISAGGEVLTTANAALLVGHGDTWRAALDGRWELIEILRPRELKRVP